MTDTARTKYRGIADGRSLLAVIGSRQPTHPQLGVPLLHLHHRPPWQVSSRLRPRCMVHCSRRCLPGYMRKARRTGLQVGPSPSAHYSSHRSLLSSPILSCDPRLPPRLHLPSPPAPTPSRSRKATEHHPAYSSRASRQTHKATSSSSISPTAASSVSTYPLSPRLPPRHPHPPRLLPLSQGNGMCSQPSGATPTASPSPPMDGS